MNNNKLPALIAVLAIVVGVGSIDSVSVFSSGFTQPVEQSDGGIKALGHVTLVAADSSGHIKAYRQTDNVVTNVGKACVGQRIFGANSTNPNDLTICGGTGNTQKFTWIGVGTSTTAETVADTTLTAPITGNRGLGTAGIAGNATNTQYSVIQRTIVANSSATVADSGLFDQGPGTGATNGHMFARKTFTGIPLNSGDSLTVTWRITYS